MLKIQRTGPNRLDIELDGKIDADEMDRSLDALIGESEYISDGLMLYKITNFEMPTFGAIGVEMTKLPKLFGLLGKFKRCAVLSDTGWIRTGAEIEGALFPGIEIKAFEMKEEAIAEKWLEE